MPKVKVYALKSSLYFEGVPFVIGDEINLPEYMVNEWLALGLVSRESPKKTAPEAQDEKPKEPKKVNLGGVLHKDRP